MDNLSGLFHEIMGGQGILVQEPMSKHTTFGIGGPADYFLRPRNTHQLGEILDLCGSRHIPWFIMGNGSNLLASDQGYRGAVIQIYRNMGRISIDGHRVTAQAGALLASLAKKAASASLSGMEFAGGIPGTLGGAVTMNAGAYGGEMKDVLERVSVLDAQGRQISLEAGQLELGYRTSVVKSSHYIVLEAVLKLVPGEMGEIRAAMEDFAQRRASRQPLGYPSAGSTFKRPEGYFAGKLIMDAGLKGYRVGDAQVSEKHCGFVVNRGHATAADVVAVMRHVQEEVKRQFQVELEPEVKFLGEFPQAGSLYEG